MWVTWVRYVCLCVCVHRLVRYQYVTRDSVYVNDWKCGVDIGYMSLVVS